jgi:hypothetical protein
LKFRKSQIALAALAACGAMPLAAQAAPSISWVNADSSRKVLVKSPVLAQDPTDSKYEPEALRAFVQQAQ